MSIWNGVKRAFGFSPEDDDEDYAVEDYAPPAPADIPEVAVQQPEPQACDEPHEPAGDPTLPADLFDAVLAVFNSAQPDFIRKCISTDAQREYLLGALSERLRSRLSRAVGTEAMAADEELRARCNSMAERVAQLEEESKAADRLRQENKKLRLSIENQKRALQDRINDLEAQAARRPDTVAVTKAQERVAQLEAEIEELRSRPEPEPAPAPTPEADPEIVAMTARELQRQTQLREQAEMKSRMADQMVSDMRNRAAEARKELEQNHAEQTEAMAMIEEKFDEFEKLKKRLEARIAELQEALKEERGEDRKAQIAKLNDENVRLRHTIENNLYNQANSEMRLRKEIKTLKEQLEAASTASAQTVAEPAPTPYQPQTAAPAPRRRGRPKKVRTDTDLSSTEWYAAPEGGESKARAAKDDPDFGYHEPARRPSNDNEAQLSLF